MRKVNHVQKRGTSLKTVVPTEDYREFLKFNENEDGTYSLTFKQLPAVLFVSYDGNGAFDQLFVYGENKPEAQQIEINSAVGELTSYSIGSLAVLKTIEKE